MLAVSMTWAAAERRRDSKMPTTAQAERCFSGLPLLIVKFIIFYYASLVELNGWCLSMLRLADINQRCWSPVYSFMPMDAKTLRHFRARLMGQAH